VDLPQPDGPTSAIFWPGVSDRFSDFNTLTYAVNVVSISFGHFGPLLGEYKADFVLKTFLCTFCFPI
jgi:hypothetical protein